MSAARNTATVVEILERVINGHDPEALDRLGANFVEMRAQLGWGFAPPADA